GVSKHVKVLERAGLVERRVAGREHWLSLTPRPLADASRWLDHYRAFWDARLEALEHMLVRENRAPKRRRRKLLSPTLCIRRSSFAASSRFPASRYSMPGSIPNISLASCARAPSCTPPP